MSNKMRNYIIEREKRVSMKEKTKKLATKKKQINY